MVQTINMQFVNSRTRALIVATILILASSSIIPVSASLENTTIADVQDDILDNVDIDNKGLENSLIKTLDSALKALENGNLKTFTNILNAFINKVEAQRGKHIDDGYAKTLIEWANKFIGTPESALDIFIFDPEYTTVIVYMPDLGVVGYELHTMVRVYKSDGVANIESVIMITPTGEEVENFSVDPAGYLNYSNYGFIWEYLPEPVFGTYMFRVVDTDGNVAERSCLIKSWIDLPLISFTPRYGENITAGSIIEWEIEWGSDPPEIDGYSLGLFPHEGGYTGYEFTGGAPPTLDTSGLTSTLDYGFHIFCSLPDIEGAVKLMGFFFLDFEST